MKRSVEFFLCAVLYGAVCAATALWAEPPEAVQLTADVMDYNMQEGAFKASGNVKLQRGDLTLTADYGRASTAKKNARLWQNVHAFGTQNGEKVDAHGAALDVDFSAPDIDYVITGGVDAQFGVQRLQSDSARMHGKKFEARQVTRYEDTKQNLTLACKSVEGLYDSGGIVQGTAEGDVTAVKTDTDRVTTLACRRLTYSRSDGTMTGTGGARIVVTGAAGSAVKHTRIDCDTLVYSFAEGTVTGTGHAQAVQEGRTFQAQTMIYHIDGGKLEAKGKPRVTVDLSSSEAPKVAAPTGRKRGKKK